MVIYKLHIPFRKMSSYRVTFVLAEKGLCFKRCSLLFVFEYLSDKRAVGSSSQVP